MSERMPTLCLDFDGVIHDYKRGWQGGQIYGAVTRGFFEWAEDAAGHFTLAVYSSRSSTPEGIAMMREWLVRQWFAWNAARTNQEDPPGVMPEDFQFVAEKPPAWLTIDDRCIRFEGSWQNLQLSPQAMLNFRPWMTR